jgi:hypothetical protein
MDGCRYVKYSAEDTAIAAVWSRDVSYVCAGIYFVPSNPTPSARASHPPRQAHIIVSVSVNVNVHLHLILPNDGSVRTAASHLLISDPHHRTVCYAAATTMKSVLAQLQPPKHHFGADDEERRELERDAAEWGSMGGFGNLGRSGAVEGMSVPRVLDVSGSCVV